jgi:hypothetical protein
MKKNNNHRPDLPEEEIQKIIHELSDTSEDDFNDLTHRLKEIIEKEKRQAFQAGLEEGRRSKK